MIHISHNGVDVFVPREDFESKVNTQMKAWFIAKHHNTIKNVDKFADVWLQHTKVGVTYEHGIQSKLKKCDMGTCQ